MTHETSGPIKPTLCPCCGYLMDRASHPTDGARRPNPGDYSLCISCGSLLSFNADFSLSKTPAEEEANLPADQRFEIERIRHAIEKVRGTTKLSKAEGSA